MLIWCAIESDRTSNVYNKKVNGELTVLQNTHCETVKVSVSGKNAFPHCLLNAIRMDMA